MLLTPTHQNLKTFEQQRLHRQRKALCEGLEEPDSVVARRLDAALARVRACKISDHSAQAALLFALGRKVPACPHS